MCDLNCDDDGLLYACVQYCFSVPYKIQMLQNGIFLLVSKRIIR